MSLLVKHSDVIMAQGTALFMSLSLLRALNKYYDLVERATTNPAIVAPSELNFVPGPGDDLESMIWAITYAITLHHQGSLRGSDMARYQRRVVNNFYGSLSYSGLADKRKIMVLGGIDNLADEPEEWIPDPAQHKWFRRAMALVASQSMSLANLSIEPITFGAFDALCDEFITEE